MFVLQQEAAFLEEIIMVGEFDLFENYDNLTTGVTYNADTGKWRVRATKGKIATISFGHYSTKSEADKVAAVVKTLKSQSAAFRYRDEIGVKGRSALRKAQRKVMQRDHLKNVTRDANVIAVTVKFPKDEIRKLLSA